MSAKPEMSGKVWHDSARPSRTPVDEPVFVLRARDILAPKVVVRWAHLAEQANLPLNKVQAALKLAKEMADWQAKYPDRVGAPD
jgi:hypothetical protein